MIDYINKYKLNLDYPIINSNLSQISISNQTNLLINKYINNFIIKNNKNFNNTFYIYNYNDDLVSLIGYYLLQIIQKYNNNFQFKLIGKIKKTKKYINKKDIIKKRKLNHILYSNITIIKNNSLYNKVEKRSKLFKKNPHIILIDNMTYSEIREAQLFYHIGYIKKDFNLENFKNIQEYTNRYKEILNKLTNPKKIVILIIETTNSKLIFNQLNQIEQTDDLVFYQFNQKTEEIFNLTYQTSLKRTINRPNQFNLNNDKLIEEISKELAIPIEKIAIKGD